MSQFLEYFFTLINANIVSKFEVSISSLPEAEEINQP